MLYFNQSFQKGVTGKHHKEQYSHVANVRTAFNRMQEQMRTLHGNAAAIIPQDVYREFDSQTKEIMRQNNLTLLNDLLPLAKALPVGKIEHVYRQASDSGVVTTSIGGQAPAQLDKADYDYDSSIKVIHQTGYGREWLELEGQRSEGFDGLIDDNANAVRSIMDQMADHVFNGADVSFKGTDAYGIKTSSKTIDVDLDSGGLNINFATSTDTSAIRTAWISMVDKLRLNDNNAKQPATYYVSGEIMSNFQNFFSTSDSGFGTIRDVLLRVNGVADIKEDESLSGNEVVGVVLSDQFIRPLVGMAVNTVPVQRVNPFDPYNFITWTNLGLEIKTDYSGRSGVLWARTIA